MSAIDRVRIMVLGDSGVGKTSFVNLAAHSEPIKSPSWTVGCSVEVKLHEFKGGTPEQTTYFVEFWDVGGSHSHRNTRSVFYNPCHGIVLVHDLTNRKSENNLCKWLDQLVNKDLSMQSVSNSEEWDSESLLGSTQIPVIVIGTKLDLVDDKRAASSRSSRLAQRLGTDEIMLDCRQARYLAAGTSHAVKLTRFYDRVIEKCYHSHVTSPSQQRYLNNSMSQVLPSKFYLPTHQD